jgi:hypothetical protein
VDQTPLTLVIETDTGVIIREIPAASPLPEGISSGAGAEVATHDAAALWGLPDFVFRADVVGVGSGWREIGDAVLHVGNLGVVVQVKARSADAVANEGRERAWLNKNVRKGLRQAHGTIRRLLAGSVRLTNARGRTIELVGPHPDGSPLSSSTTARSPRRRRRTRRASRIRQWSSRVATGSSCGSS